MGILKKIKKKIKGKKEEVPKIEKEEEEGIPSPEEQEGLEWWDEEKEEEEEEEEKRKIMVKDILIEPVPKVIEERRDTELPLIVLKDQEEVIAEKEVEKGLEEPRVGRTISEEVIDQSEIIEVEEYLKKVEKEREENLEIKEEEVMVMEEERTIAEKFGGLPLGERLMKWFEEVFLGDEEVVEATRGLEDTVCSFICQDTQFYIEKKGVGNPAIIVEGRSLKPDAHVRVSVTAAENVIRVKDLEVAETVLFEKLNNMNVKFNVDVLDLTKKGYLRVPILRNIVR